MGWLQILSLVVQELPALETATLDTVQFIVSIVHAASGSTAAPSVGAAAAALKPKAKTITLAPVPPTPPANPTGPAIFPVK